MTDDLLYEDVRAEIAAIEDARAHMIENRDAHPELDHWKLPWQLEALDRHLARLKEIA